MSTDYVIVLTIVVESLSGSGEKNFIKSSLIGHANC